MILTDLTIKKGFISNLGVSGNGGCTNKTAIPWGKWWFKKTRGFAGALVSVWSRKVENPPVAMLVCWKDAASFPKYHRFYTSKTYGHSNKLPITNHSISKALQPRSKFRGNPCKLSSHSILGLVVVNPLQKGKALGILWWGEPKHTQIK